MQQVQVTEKKKIVGAGEKNSIEVHTRESIEMECYKCKHIGYTDLKYKNGSVVWLIVLIMCLLGFGFLAFIPCCISSIKDVEHMCSKCNTKIGGRKADNPW